MRFFTLNKPSLFRVLTTVIFASFLFTNVIPQEALAQVVNLPVQVTMGLTSPQFVPVMMKGVVVHPENPLLFDFLIDNGKTELDINSNEFKDESQKLIKYFLASLTIKEEDLWVNLSPYEKDRIMVEELGRTELGRDMLAQDYILKQLTASLLNPEEKIGAEFWEKIYKKANERFGTIDIPVDTFNKVWIVADSAKVLERNDTAYVVEAKLKVMLDTDYLAMQNKEVKDRSTDIAASSASINTAVLREVIIPAIEREVNEGENFAPLRQIYNSMILATWYKQTLKEALLNQVYSNKGKTHGVNSDDPQIKEKIYEQYLESFKKGVYNYIKEDYDPVTQDIIPRRYFSGGQVMAMEVGKNLTVIKETKAKEVIPNGDMAMVTANMESTNSFIVKSENQGTIALEAQVFSDAFNKLSEKEKIQIAGIVADFVKGTDSETDEAMLSDMLEKIKIIKAMKAASPEELNKFLEASFPDLKQRDEFIQILKEMHDFNNDNIIKIIDGIRKKGYKTEDLKTVVREINAIIVDNSNYKFSQFTTGIVAAVITVISSLVFIGTFDYGTDSIFRFVNYLSIGFVISMSSTSYFSFSKYFETGKDKEIKSSEIVAWAQAFKNSLRYKNINANSLLEAKLKLSFSIESWLFSSKKIEGIGNSNLANEMLKVFSVFEEEKGIYNFTIDLNKIKIDSAMTADKGKILIVDDNPIVRVNFQDLIDEGLFDPYDVTVLDFEDAEKWVEANNNQIGMIITDTDNRGEYKLQGPDLIKNIINKYPALKPYVFAWSGKGKPVHDYSGIEIETLWKEKDVNRIKHIFDEKMRKDFAMAAQVADELPSSIDQKGFYSLKAKMVNNYKTPLNKFSIDWWSNAEKLLKDYAENLKTDEKRSDVKAENRGTEKDILYNDVLKMRDMAVKMYKIMYAEKENLIKEISFKGKNISLITGNIIREKADVVVCPMNTEMEIDSEIAAAFLRGLSPYLSKNPEFDRSLIFPEKKGGYRAGQAVAVDIAKFKVPMRWKYFVSAIIKDSSGLKKADSIKKATKDALAKADDKKARSLVFPALTADYSGTGYSSSAKAMFSAVEDYFDEKPESSIEEIKFVLSEKEGALLFRTEMERLLSGPILHKDSAMTAREYYDYGLILKERGKLSQAANLFRKSIEKDNNFIDAYIELGLISMSLNNDEQAITYFKKILELGYANLSVYIMLAKLFYQNKDFDAAIDQLKNIIKVDPNNIHAHKLMYKCLSFKNKYFEALEELNIIEKMEPTADNLSEKLRYAGIVQMQLGNFENGVNLYKEAISVQPYKISNYLFLAYRYILKGFRKEASEILQDGLKIDSGNENITSLLIANSSLSDEDMAFYLRNIFNIDNAMLAEDTFNSLGRMDLSKAPGGIDLSENNLEMDITKEGKGIEMKIDPVLIEEFMRGDFSGVTPVIIQIVPIASPLPLLGLSKSDEEIKLSKS